ncbi:MAG: HigA family addiction module antidote protein [Synergistales bacterium]|nr:HigA family addiction module antidote protein [Synergistales bacterium]
MGRIPEERPPTHPGDMLRQEFLIPLGISQRQLAQGIRVPYQRVNEIVNMRRGITPETALRLARYLGMSEGFWLNLQQRWDLYQARLRERDELAAIQPLNERSPSAPF